MAIGSEIERGSLVVVKVKGSDPHDGLLGFTATVTVRFRSTIFTYDERGITIYSRAA